MPILYAAPQSVPEPFAVHRPDTAHTFVTAVAPVTIPWSDGSSDLAIYDQTTTAQSAYGGVEVDTTLFVWLLIAVKGLGHPLLVKEADYPTNMDTLTGSGSWARIGRIQNGRVDVIPQV